MKTSTGEECWRLKTGSLLDDAPVIIHGVDEVPEKGTIFEIRFKKTISLSEELAKIKAVLHKYCLYLNMDIIVLGKTSESIHNSILAKGDWHIGPEVIPFSCPCDDFGKQYEVIIGMGTGKHSIYQNRVLISTGYNLLSQDNGRTLNLPLLDIRISSPDFKPTFGRNRLTNEFFLNSISENLKENLVPSYFTMLSEKYNSGLLRDYNIEVSQIETLACSILAHNTHWIKSAWDLKIFRTKNGQSLSYKDLEGCNLLYLENEDSSGVDFSVFDAPVISLQQPAGGLDLIKKQFSGSLTNLGLKDIVIEVPKGSSVKLDPQEIAFESYLGFHPDAINQNFDQSENGNPADYSSELTFKLQDKGFLDKLCEESQKAQIELRDIEWKVNYLVGRDGATPNKTHKFILNGDRIVLNLYHDEIQKLVRLSSSVPALAGHWAMAICLSESNNILNHLTPEAREDLLLIDAMARCGNNYCPKDKNKMQNNIKKLYNDRFQMEIDNIDLWL